MARTRALWILWEGDDQRIALEYNSQTDVRFSRHSLMVCNFVEQTFAAVGKNRHGQWGTEHPRYKEYESMQLIKYFLMRGIHIVGIFSNSASDCIFWKTIDGNIFATGNNEHGQLGVPTHIAASVNDNIYDNDSGDEDIDSDEEDIGTPRLVSSLQNCAVLSMESNPSFSIALCNTPQTHLQRVANVWSRQHGASTEVTELILRFAHCNAVFVAGFGLSEWREMEGLRGKHITQMSVGCAHAMFLEANGVLWAFGDHNHGQCGLGVDVSTFFVTEPTAIPFFVEKDIQIREVRCGFDHTLALSTNALLYSFGANQRGQCGDDTTVSISIPQRIPFIDTFTRRGLAVASFDCGSHHSFCRTEDGVDWLWGSNDFGDFFFNGDLLGTHLSEDVLQPHSMRESFQKRFGENECVGIESVKLGFHATAITYWKEQNDEEEKDEN